MYPFADVVCRLAATVRMAPSRPRLPTRSRCCCASRSTSTTCCAASRRLQRTIMQAWSLLRQAGRLAREEKTGKYLAT